MNDSSTNGSLRAPPHSLEAEQSVLGAVLIEGARGAPHNAAWEAVGSLSEQAFFRIEHRIIFEAMCELAEANTPIDILTLADRLEAGPHPGRVGIAYLAELAEETPSAVNVEAYCAIVAERYGRRRRIADGAALQEAAYSGDLEGLAEVQARIAEGDYGGSWAAAAVPFNDLPEPEPIDWLAADLFYLGGVYCIVGPPKAGKTAAARTLATVVASDEERLFLGRKTRRGNVVYIDYENPRTVSHERFAKLRAGGLSVEGLAVHLAAPHPPDMAAAVVRLRAEIEARKPLLVVIDGLQGWAAIEDLSDYSHVHAAIAPLRELAEVHNCTILFQHHGSKHSPTDPSGSNALAGNVDGILAFNKTGVGDVTYTAHTAELREGRHLPKSNVAIGDDGRSVLDGTAAERAGEEDAAERRKTALAYVAENGEVRHSDLLKSMQGRPAARRATLEELLRDGCLRSIGRQRGRGENALRYRVESDPT